MLQADKDFILKWYKNEFGDENQKKKKIPKTPV